MVRDEQINLWLCTMQISDCALLQKYFVSIVPRFLLGFFFLQGASRSHPCWIWTCLCMPMTLEGGGTISQLSNATPERSRTVKGHSQFNECKTNEQSTFHLQYILWGPVMNETVCSQRAGWSTRNLEMSCWLSTWREMQSPLELSDKTLRVSGSKLIDDYG